MPSLKDLKIRIASVKATQKITSAMKMVAVSKLRRAQEYVEGYRPYVQAIIRMTQAVRTGLNIDERDLSKIEEIPKILRGSGHDHVHLLILFTSESRIMWGLE